MDTQERTSTCVFVGNLPYDSTEEDLAHFFSTSGITPLKVTLMRHESTGLFKGCAIVEVEGDGTAACSLSGQLLNGRTVPIRKTEMKAKSDLPAPREKNSCS